MSANTCIVHSCNNSPDKTSKKPFLKSICKSCKSIIRDRLGLGSRATITEADLERYYKIIEDEKSANNSINESVSSSSSPESDIQDQQMESNNSESQTDIIDENINESINETPNTLTWESDNDNDIKSVHIDETDKSSDSEEESIASSSDSEESQSSDTILNEEEEEDIIESISGEESESSGSPENEADSSTNSANMENNSNEMDGSTNTVINSPVSVDATAMFSESWDDTVVTCMSDSDLPSDDESSPAPVKESSPAAPAKESNPPAPVKESSSPDPAKKDIKNPIVFCRTFNSSMIYGEKVQTNKNTKVQSIKTDDQTTFIVDIARITEEFVKCAKQFDLDKRLGTSWVSKKYGSPYTFCEWVAAEPKIYKQSIDKETFVPIIHENTIETATIPGYHPHFDIDVGEAEYEQIKSILTELQLFELYLYLFNSFAESFGSKVSISAYTNVKAIHDKYPQCPYYKDCSKVISIHAIYYECILSTKDIETLGTSTFPTDEIEVEINGKKKKLQKPRQIIKYTIDGIEKDIPLWGVDGNIFKIGDGQGRKWRHHFAPKGKYNRDTKHTDISYFPGAIINDNSLDFRSQFIHPSGSEKLITYADVIKSPKWLQVYEITEKTPAKRSHKKKVVKTDSKMGINDIEWADSVISMPSDAILELFDEVAPNHTHPELQHIICAFIGNCPMDYDSAASLVEQWYHKGTHENMGSDSSYMQYYSYSETNKWFYSLLKHLPKDRREYYKNTYAPLSIDSSININDSHNTIDDNDSSQSFGIDETGKVLEYMRGCIGVVKQRHFYKEIHDGTPVVSECNENTLRLILDGVHPFKGNYNITLYHLYRKYKDFLRYTECKLYNPANTAIDSSKVINLFQGYKYTPVKSHKLGYEVVTPLLNHIKEVICNGDDFKYNTFIKNLAFYVKKPGQKLGIIPIVWGAGKGSGKTIVFDIICDILGDKAAMNNASMKDAFGDFNPHIDTTVLCVINEAPNWEQGHVNAENVIRAATESKVVKNMKGINQYVVDSFTNYVITCNEPNPIREGFENRRTQYYHVNDKYIGNRKYFKQLMTHIQPHGPKTTYDKKAMETILHYFLNEIDISDYDPEASIYDELMRYDEVYNDKLERSYESGGKVLQEIVDHFENYIDGIDFDGIKNNMTLHNENTGISMGMSIKVNTLRNELAKYVKPIQKRNGNQRIRLYYMNKDKFLYSLIKYKHQDDNCDFNKLDEYFKDVLSEDSAEPEQLDIYPADM